MIEFIKYLETLSDERLVGYFICTAILMSIIASGFKGFVRITYVTNMPKE